LSPQLPAKAGFPNRAASSPTLKNENFAHHSNLRTRQKVSSPFIVTPPV
jgi:hypothetical protein